MAAEIVPGKLFLGPEVSVPTTVERLRGESTGVLVIRCMESPPDVPEYIATLGPILTAVKGLITLC